MPIITQRRAQEAVLDHQAGRIERMVSARQNNRANVATSGLSDSINVSGFYDADGNFRSYMRLGVDAFNSGRGCAP